MENQNQELGDNTISFTIGQDITPTYYMRISPDMFYLFTFKDENTSFKVRSDGQIEINSEISTDEKLIVKALRDIAISNYNRINNV